MVTASAGRGANCDVKENYGWARARLGSYANCQVLPGGSPTGGNRVIAVPRSIIDREVVKPKKVENMMHIDRKKAIKDRVGREG